MSTSPQWKPKINQANPCLKHPCTDWFPMLDITKVGHAHHNAASAERTNVSGTKPTIQIKPRKVDTKMLNCQNNIINISAKNTLKTINSGSANLATISSRERLIQVSAEVVAEPVRKKETIVKGRYQKMFKTAKEKETIVK
jgi:hypothetical protein